MGANRTPNVYVIGGPNGAGKTTFATEYLPGFVDCREFVNADLIAAGLSPFAPETQAIRAGRLMLSRIAELSGDRRDFGFETTFAGRAHVRLLSELKRSGYRVVLFFLWLPDAELAVRRVAIRVREGGHHVPEATVRRRFEAGLRNFFREYAPRADAWYLYDGTVIPPAEIASGDGSIVVSSRPDQFRAIHARWGGGPDA